MDMPFFYLCLQTLLLWVLVIFLHRYKNRFTLIPLYTYIAVLTFFTHNLSDLGFSLTINNLYLLIGSVSFFTTLMLGILFLYLFEGPRAARLALLIVLSTSFLYIGIVFLLSLQVDTSNWVLLGTQHYVIYFFSITAIIVDVFFIAIAWELLGKISTLPLLIKVFLVIFGTFLIDTLIFVSGVFGSQSTYLSVLQGNLTVRFVLALLVAPIASFFLRQEGYREDARKKPKVAWEILNFKSDLESKIETMEETIRQSNILKSELEESHETYLLALEGANAGIWDWNIKKNRIMFSPKFRLLLGYEEKEFSSTLEEFKGTVHSDDLENTFSSLDKSFADKKPYSIEYRLRTKDGLYKWFLCGGKTKYGVDGKPVRMVGSIIDINEKKQVLKSYEDKVEELEKFNKAMVDRELQMIDLKKELKQLKDT